MATVHPDLVAEQAHIDRAYARIEQLRAAAEARRDEVIAEGKGGTHQAREERDVIVRASALRLIQLDVRNDSLCFGRIDRTTGEAFHIGRMGVADVDQEQLIVDWRAPVAEPFYRATGRHPMGLVRRRHLHTQGRVVTAIEDELLDVDALRETTTLIGEGALLAALERSRSGAMRDIVATIQAEQDDIIRSELPGVLVVQGGPGTGKTAVALHRAAYLLYTYRFPLERQGLLVVGPNLVFLRYIDHVLPSLGETGVTLSTVAGLYEGPARPMPGAHDATLAARVKGDLRMAKVLAKAVRDRQRPLRDDVGIPFGAHMLRLSVAMSADVVAAAKRRPGAHNLRRPFVETQVIRRLHQQYEASASRTGAATKLRDVADFGEDVLEMEAVREALDRMWPVLTAEELVHDLFGARALLDLAARNQLTDPEVAAVHRPRSETFDAIPWTVADLALLDEADVLLGRRRRRIARGTDRAATSGNGDEPALHTFGHVVVDEAQDLTPMQLRMLARRSLGGSMTVVGDIGQATGPHSPRDWSDVLAHLPSRKASRLVELTVNYRTPSEIMDVASRVLAAAAPDLSPPTSVRSVGIGPQVVTAPRAEDLAAVAHRTARELQAEIGGTVAVICPPSLAGALGALADDQVSLDAPVAVVPVATVKGLEFDGVVVVEPAVIADESPQGLRALYVALTRATKRVTVVHAAPLPAVLGLG